MPVWADASRWEIPAVVSASETTRAMALDTSSGVPMRITVVPTWNNRKAPRGVRLLQSCDWKYLDWCYRALVTMSDNSRERSAWSAATAAQVRAERAALDWTQEQVAKASGIPRITYIRIEKGQRVPDVTQLARLCGVFRLPMSEFVARVEARVQAG